MRIKTVFVTAVLAGAGWAAAHNVPIEDVESAYWDCIKLDARYSADGQRMDEFLLSNCAAISKRLQVDRFGDDFGKLHEWTNAEKVKKGSQNVTVGTSRYTE
jgi:hypothetical protein